MSTFTGWNGPQNGPARSDWRELIQDYKDCITALGDKQDKLTWDSAPTQSSLNPVTSGGIWNVTSALQRDLTDLLALLNRDYQTKDVADNKYQAKIYGTPATESWVNSVLNNYLQENDLSDTQVIRVLDQAVEGLTNRVTDAEVEIADTELEKAIIRATDYIEGMIHAIEQVQFTFKHFAAEVGGTDTDDVYYLLGMIDQRAGTAYLRFSNTKSWAAVVQFAVTYNDDTGTFTDGQLSVTTDLDKADIGSHVHFKIVTGTDSDGQHHVYLAMSATNWNELFNNPEPVSFDGAGINFIPLKSEGYKRPNGTTSVLVDVDYYAIEDRMRFLEEQVNTLKGRGVGVIYGWNNMELIPEWAHACDGTPIDTTMETAAELIALYGPNYPLIDYHIVQIG